MRFLHISDLHLGRRLDNISLIDDQVYILKQIFNIIQNSNIDAVLVAGDIYDKSIPSIEATKLLNDTFEKFLELNVPIYIVSGNHDSVERLSFGSSIFKKSNLYISNAYDGTIQKETLSDEFGEVNIYLMPYVNSMNIKLSHNVDFHNLADGFKIAIENAHVDTTKRNILVAHQYVMRTKEESLEFEDHLGGTENVYSSIFADTFDYTALGHIHKPYWVVKDKVRYCGSPLKYSVKEYTNKNSVTILDIKEKGNVSFEEVELKPLRNLRRIRGNLKDILENAVNTNDYVDITLTDEDYIINAMGRLRDTYPNVLKLSFENSRTQYTSSSNTSASGVEEKSMLELFEDFCSSIYGKNLKDNPKLLEVVQEVINDLDKEMAHNETNPTNT